MSKFDKGVLLIAYNNGKIDYEKLAVVAASNVKRHMKNNHVTLLTDVKTLTALTNELTTEQMSSTMM